MKHNIQHYIYNTLTRSAKGITKTVALLTTTLGLVSQSVFAADPFGAMNITAANLESKAGSTTSSTLQYVLISIGVLLCAIGAIKLIGIATKDRNDKDEHGNNLIGIMILILCVFLGLVLIGIGWQGATATVNPG